MPRSSPGTPLHERRARGATLDPQTGCVEWQRSLTKKGYGRIGVGLSVRLAHQVAYEVSVGPVPEGCELDHTCRNPRCINPAHLEPVTHRENVLRGTSFAAENATKTRCAHGHPYTPDNTYQRPSGARDCRACIRARVTAYRQRRNAA